jgi:hypothetical protein
VLSLVLDPVLVEHAHELQDSPRAVGGDENIAPTSHSLEHLHHDLAMRKAVVSARSHPQLTLNNVKRQLTLLSRSLSLGCSLCRFIESVISSVGRLQRHRERSLATLALQHSPHHRENPRERVEDGLLKHVLRAVVVVHCVDDVVLCEGGSVHSQAGPLVYRVQVAVGERREGWRESRTVSFMMRQSEPPIR